MSNSDKIDHLYVLKQKNSQEVFCATFFQKSSEKPQHKLTPLHRFFFWFRKAQKKKLCKKKTPREFRSLRRATRATRPRRLKTFCAGFGVTIKMLSRYRWGVRESYLRKNTVRQLWSKLTTFMSSNKIPFGKFFWFFSRKKRTEKPKNKLTSERVSLSAESDEGSAPSTAQVFWKKLD